MNNETRPLHGTIITNCAEQSSPLPNKFSNTNFRVNRFIEIVNNFCINIPLSLRSTLDFQKLRERKKDVSKGSRLFLILRSDRKTLHCVWQISDSKIP